MDLSLILNLSQPFNRTSPHECAGQATLEILFLLFLRKKENYH